MNLSAGRSDCRIIDARFNLIINNIAGQHPIDRYPAATSHTDRYRQNVGVRIDRRIFKRGIQVILGISIQDIITKCIHKRRSSGRQVLSLQSDVVFRGDRGTTDRCRNIIGDLIAHRRDLNGKTTRTGDADCQCAYNR